MEKKEIDGKDFCGFCGKFLKGDEDLFCSKCEDDMNIDGSLKPTEDVNLFSECF